MLPCDAPGNIDDTSLRYSIDRDFYLDSGLGENYVHVQYSRMVAITRRRVDDQRQGDDDSFTSAEGAGGSLRPGEAESGKQEAGSRKREAQ